MSERMKIRELNRPALRPDVDEYMSTADAAKLLFVSRRYVVKLLDQGKLKLHHITGNNRFVRMDSVLAYQAAQQAAIAAYHASAAEEE
ncbi:helix-turn-helix domain-containing protein [Caballeronia sp. LjRoot34]|uniref:excisionase family DNA-binding protein n=1 Tax=Caballeronia sp. LjRoot34 TaxID=3342325 RepID=UPI003ECCEE21